MVEWPVTWVVGARGLLGSAVVRVLRQREAPVLTVATPWADPVAAVAALDDGARRLVATGSPWRVAWCAGAGVVGTTEADLGLELDVLEGFLAAFARRLSQAPGPRGSLFLASSAGGVYAGSGPAPFNEDTAPRPTSPYGRAKLATERLVEEFADRTGTSVTIGRIANLYGPGQDIGKPQGLISQLCLHHLRRRPISIYVSLDTARDYVFVDDCARMVLALLDHADSEGGRHTKIMATGQATTLASILGVLKQVTKRPPLVVLGASPLAQFQTMSLRFRSTEAPDLQRYARTTLAAGVATTMDSVAGLMREGRLPS